MMIEQFKTIRIYSYYFVAKSLKGPPTSFVVEPHHTVYTAQKTLKQLPNFWHIDVVS